MGEMRSLARFRFLLALHLRGVLLTEDFFGEKPLPLLLFFTETLRFYGPAAVSVGNYPCSSVEDRSSSTGPPCGFGWTISRPPGGGRSNSSGP